VVKISKMDGLILTKAERSFVINGRILNQISTDNEGFKTHKSEDFNLDSINKYATNP
jgi:hypothetical protein